MSSDKNESDERAIDKEPDSDDFRQDLDHTVGMSSESLRGANVDDPTTAGSGRQSGPTSKSRKPGSKSGYAEQVGNSIGPYKLLQEIGAGGMGTVFMAEQLQPVSRRVALKIIKAGMDSEQIIARFEAERQALSMMEHPNIARVLDVGTTDHGRPFFVMELVNGKPITSVCDKLKLDIEARLNLFCDVCAAVQHAHQKGIIHRDLKPSNILLTMHDERPVPKVIDFGVAKATNQRLTEKTMFTQFGEVVGTLEYMSPEQSQMTDLNIDTRSDIYSLGVLLYELLTGSTPLKRQRTQSAGYLQMLSRISDEDAPKPSSRLTESADKLELIAESRGVEPRKLSSVLRGDLDWIVLKALEKDRTRRYETATGFADDVKRYLNAEPISARSPSGIYLLRKFTRRHRVAVIAGTAVLISLIAGITAATWQAVRAKRAETLVANQFAELQHSSELEKTNIELSKKIELETEAQKATRLGQIRSTVSRGQWEEGIEQIESYGQEFNEIPIEISILRLYALDGLSRSDELEAEVLRLEKHPDADEFRAQLQLWRGYSFISAGSDGEDSKSLIQSAIDRGLTEDDRFFAEGLVADSPAIAVEKFKAALKVAPFHAKARSQLIITLILLGRYEEVQREIQIAKALFTNDHRIFIADTVSHALANRPAATSLALTRLSSQFPAVEIEDVQGLVSLARSVNQQFKVYDQAGLFDWFSILQQSISLFQDEGMQSIPVPEFQKELVFKAYFEFANSFLNPLLPLMSERRKHNSTVRSCRKAFNIHPDGLFKCFEAWSWYALNDFEKSLEAFDVASKSDGLFPEIKRQAMYGAFLTRMALYKADADQDKLQDAIGFLEAYVAGGFEKHRAAPMFEAACTARRWKIARDIVDQMIEQNESKALWFDKLIDQAIRQDNYGVALSACDEILLTESNPTIEDKRVQIIKLISKEGEN